MKNLVKIAKSNEIYIRIFIKNIFERTCNMINCEVGIELRRKLEKVLNHSVRNKKEDISIVPEEQIRGYYKNVYANELDISI
jgi:hypothetical protein